MFLRLWYWFSGPSNIDLNAGDNSISLSPAQISVSFGITLLTNEILFAANNPSLTLSSIVNPAAAEIIINASGIELSGKTTITSVVSSITAQANPAKIARNDSKTTENNIVTLSAGNVYVRASMPNRPMLVEDVDATWQVARSPYVWTAR